MRIRRVTNSATFLTVVLCIVNALLKSSSASGASKFTGILDSVGMKLSGKLGSVVGVKVPFKKIKSLLIKYNV